ncbi:hypothetical protein [Sphingobium lactosutens]|uniref:hypothetical protein n=1 Tax=Sphingobium lactosutens TaxID=522773 RepID=UPI0021194875|nr:hypothetical protein [Sphingobium lactosutens]
MPKMTDRERLAKIEADQQSLAQEAETVRQALRAHYGKIATDLAVERLSEREFRDVLSHAIRVGGGAAIAALKPLSAASAPPEQPPLKKPAEARSKPPQGSGTNGDDKTLSVVQP